MDFAGVDVGNSTVTKEEAEKEERAIQWYQKYILSLTKTEEYKNPSCHTIRIELYDSYNKDHEKEYQTALSKAKDAIKTSDLEKLKNALGQHSAIPERIQHNQQVLQSRWNGIEETRNSILYREALRLVTLYATYLFQRKFSAVCEKGARESKLDPSKIEKITLYKTQLEKVRQNGIFQMTTYLTLMGQNAALAEYRSIIKNDPELMEIWTDPAIKKLSPEEKLELKAIFQGQLEIPSELVKTETTRMQEHLILEETKLAPASKENKIVLHSSQYPRVFSNHYQQHLNHKTPLVQCKKTLSDLLDETDDIGMIGDMIQRKLPCVEKIKHEIISAEKKSEKDKEEKNQSHIMNVDLDDPQFWISVEDPERKSSIKKPLLHFAIQHYAIASQTQKKSLLSLINFLMERGCSPYVRSSDKTAYTHVTPDWDLMILTLRHMHNMPSPASENQRQELLQYCINSKEQLQSGWWNFWNSKMIKNTIRLSGVIELTEKLHATSTTRSDTALALTRQEQLKTHRPPTFHGSGLHTSLSKTDTAVKEGQLLCLSNNAFPLERQVVPQKKEKKEEEKTITIQVPSSGSAFTLLSRSKTQKTYGALENKNSSSTIPVLTTVPPPLMITVEKVNPSPKNRYSS